MKLRALAPGKINLCLFLGGQRPDGRHELVTLFESLSLADELELSVLDGGSDQVHCPGVGGVNLITRALQGLRARGWSAPPVRIEVRKRIPVAAGMGGGSADAAATLRIAQRLAPLPDRALSELAAELGADVPSQLEPGLVLGTGAGDVVRPVAPLAPHVLVIVPQPTPLSTADVYREAERLQLPRTADGLESLRTELLSELGRGGRVPPRLLANDLEPATTSLCPGIGDALAAVRAAGAANAIVCGSGPTVAGLYWEADAPRLAAAAAAALAVRYPGAATATPVQSDCGSPQFA